MRRPPKLYRAQRLKRTSQFDSTVCPLCARTLRVIADITNPAVVTSERQPNIAGVEREVAFMPLRPDAARSLRRLATRCKAA